MKLCTKWPSISSCDLNWEGLVCVTAYVTKFSQG